MMPAFGRSFAPRPLRNRSYTVSDMDTMADEWRVDALSSGTFRHPWLGRHVLKTARAKEFPDPARSSTRGSDNTEKRARCSRGGPGKRITIGSGFAFSRRYSNSVVRHITCKPIENDVNGIDIYYWCGYCDKCCNGSDR